MSSNVAESGIRSAQRIIREGGSLYDAYYVVYAGVDPATGSALFYKDPDNGDFTKITDYNAAKQSDLGTTLPDVYGGFGTQLSFYGFDLSAQFSLSARR